MCVNRRLSVTVVDALSEYMVPNFDDQKYDDRNDWMTLESLKVHALEEGILAGGGTKTRLLFCFLLKKKNTQQKETRLFIHRFKKSPPDIIRLEL